MSDERSLTNTNQQDSPTLSPTQLHNNGLQAGSLIEASLSRLNPEQTQALLVKAAEERLRLEAKLHEQNIDYVAGKKAIEDHVDAFNMLDKNGRTTRQSVNSEIKTGAGNMKIESKSGATCFVASVAYDNPNHPDVIYLRSFRDGVLVNSVIGRHFISWYWATGPKIAKIVGRSYSLQLISRVTIKSIISIIRISTSLTTWRK